MATWRCSRSLFVKISPLTLTSTCSKISARMTVVAATKQRAAMAVLNVISPCNLSFYSAGTPAGPKGPALQFEQVAQQGADTFEYPARRARVLGFRLEHLGFGEPRLHLSLTRPNSPPGRGERRARSALRRAKGWGLRATRHAVTLRLQCDSVILSP